MRPLPESTRIDVPEELARALLEAAESLPRYDNLDFYSPRLQAELRDAVRARVTAGHDDLLGNIRERLRRAPYCALVRGLKFDDNHRLFVALNRALGVLVAPPYQPPRAQLVHYIQPSTDIRSSRNTRTESERLHTDSADWENPVEIISMICAHPDRRGGGRSQILALDDVRSEVAEGLGAAALERLESEPVPWQLADYRGGDVAWYPILAEASLRWRPYTVDAALAADGVELAEDMLAILDAVDRLLAGSQRIYEFLMQENEFLVTDNHRALHARTRLDGDYRTSGRLMIRSWIQSSPNGSTH